jgi:hypothetical protein
MVKIGAGQHCGRCVCAHGGVKTVAVGKDPHAVAREREYNRQHFAHRLVVIDNEKLTCWHDLLKHVVDPHSLPDDALFAPRSAEIELKYSGISMS